MKTFEILVDELVKIEMDDSCHMDDITDYESAAEYYISNAKLDSYPNSYLKETYLTKEEVEAYDVYELQQAVINRIKFECDVEGGLL